MTSDDARHAHRRYWQQLKGTPRTVVTTEPKFPGVSFAADSLPAVVDVAATTVPGRQPVARPRPPTHPRRQRVRRPRRRRPRRGREHMRVRSLSLSTPTGTPTTSAATHCSKPAVPALLPASPTPTPSHDVIPAAASPSTPSADIETYLLDRAWLQDRPLAAEVAGGARRRARRHHGRQRCRRAARWTAPRRRRTHTRRPDHPASAVPRPRGPNHTTALTSTTSTMGEPVTAAPTPMIDTWMQHPGQRWLDNEMFSSLRRWKPTVLGDRPADHDHVGDDGPRRCRAWAAVCLVGSARPIISNDDVAELCTAHPDRFVGVASDLMRPMAAVSELRRCVEVHGFRALRLLPWLWGLPPDDRCAIGLARPRTERATCARGSGPSPDEISAAWCAATRRCQ